MSFISKRRSEPTIKIKRGIGVKNGNPRVCIVCRVPIRAGERWVVVSNTEYSIIKHATCAAMHPVHKSA